jgi:hypothetical protein
VGLRIENVVCEGLPFKLDWKGLDKEKHAQIHVRGSLPSTFGVHEGKVTIFVSGAKVASQVVAVECLVQHQVLAEPQELLLVVRPPFEQRSRDVRIRSEFPCRIESVFSSSPSVSFGYDRQPLAKEHIVKIQLDPHKVDAAFLKVNGIVRVRGDERVEECSVPIVVVKQSAD